MWVCVHFFLVQIPIEGLLLTKPSSTHGFLYLSLYLSLSLSYSYTPTFPLSLPFALLNISISFPFKILETNEIGWGTSWPKRWRTQTVSLSHSVTHYHTSLSFSLFLSLSNMYYFPHNTHTHTHLCPLTQMFFFLSFGLLSLCADSTRSWSWEERCRQSEWQSE